MKYLKSISLKIIFVLALVACLLNPKQLAAQSSLVPSYHPVYEWLYLQRVKGFIQDYDYESLPLTRKTILNHLRGLEGQDEIGSRSEELTLNSFIQEFDPDHLNKDETHSLIQKGKKLSFDRARDWLSGNHERHLYSSKTDKGFLIFDHAFGRRSMFVDDDGDNRSAPYILNQFWRSYGSYENYLGYHIEFIRAVPVGDQRIFEFDRFYSANWKFLNDSGNLNHHYEAYATANYDIFELSIGRGNLKEGIGRNQNLVFSRESITTDWVRFKIDTEFIGYKFMHITQSFRAIRSVLPGDSTIATNNSPRRFTAYHKVDLKPWKWLTLSAYEMINYSNRGVELAYINPVNRYAFGEFELQNQDNGWAGFSMVMRPIRGLELYSEILIDDLGDREDLILKKQFPRTSRFGRRYGGTYANRSAWQFWTEYTRLDPFTYSHPFDLNAHTDKGIGLGSQIGPNADRLEFGMQKWFRGRSFVRLAYSSDRQGLDEFDSNGNLIFTSGSNVNDGRDSAVNASFLFLDGDLHEWHRIQLDAQWELKRGYVVRPRLEQRWIRKGNQIGDQRIMWVDLIIGF